MFLRMFKVYQAIGKNFHKWFSPLFTFFGILLLHIVVSIGLLLDYMFFPSLRKKKVERPIVVVGNPRSGTTFLQRFLVDHGFGAGMRIWKMLYPSLVLQIFIKPLLPLLEKLSPARFHAQAVHDTNLTNIETDDPALLFRFFDGFFLYGFFLAWAKTDLKAMFDPDTRDTSVRDFNWLETIWKRNLISEKKNRVVAKVFSLSVRIPRFLKKFPDAKILYLIRDPLETVPSGLSLVTGVLDNRFGFWNLPENKRNQYIERLYGAFLDLNLRFHHDYFQGRIPEENIKLVLYSRLMQDFDNLMQEIMEFLDFKPTAEFLQIIKKTSDQQKQYKSKHKYDLEKFGLDEARIRKDYAPIYADFLQA